MNAALIAQLILQGLQQLQQYQQLLIRAQAENRDVLDSEIDALGALGDQIRAAARAEADRQRAGG
jgi:F0F1-type ATP synthase membrane subunit b/b'